MKVLFLDIDGVLNSHRWAMAGHMLHRKAPPGEAIDPGAVALLNAIIERTGAKVVISSTWRLFEKDMPGILAGRGFKGEVIGQTPELTAGPSKVITTSVPRGREIVAWLLEHPEVDRFVILDDDSDMEAVVYRHIKTDFDDGLLPRHVELAVSYLAGPRRARRARSRNYRLPPQVLSVTRPGRWGNPYVGDLALDAFRVRALDMNLEPLRGRDLACWCKPDAPCHADILLELANKESESCKSPLP